MQATSSKTTHTSKSTSKKEKNISGQNQQLSRTRNTSDNESGSGVGRTLILCDGRNVTPKSLVPAVPKDVRTQGSEEAKAAAEGSGGQVDGATGEDGARAGAPGEEVAIPQATLVPEKGKAVKPPGLTKEELERNVDIILSETETETLLSFPSLCVDLQNEKSALVTARNKAYDDLQHSKADSDQYREQHVQTLNHPHKSKEVLAAPPSQENVEVNANPWDIYDTFATEPVAKDVQIQQACERESLAIVAQAIKKPGCLFNMNEPYPTSEPLKEATTKTGPKSGTKSGGVNSGKSGALGGSLNISKPSGVVSAASGAVATPQTSQVSAVAGEDRVDAVTSQQGAAPATPAPGAPDAAAVPGADEKAAAEEKVGANNPIPEELAQALRTMERIVSQNVFHKQHMIYRNYPTLEELAKLDEMRADESTNGNDLLGIGVEGANGAEPRAAGRSGDAADGAEAGGEDSGEPVGNEINARDEAASSKPSLQDLFCFDAPQLTQGMTVTCAEWNRHNMDLLAVSYGDTEPVPNLAGGLVLFWSLKNPTYPERVIRTKNGVTALHFSSVHPNMVAAGTHDGSVMIWDLRRPTDAPMFPSGNDLVKKHTDIVWETRWVDRGPEKLEQLVSVSSDGNVFQWSMKKGLEQNCLMQLKRIQNPHLGSNSVCGHKEGIVFRKSSGFCVDFPKHDPSTYLVGTEDGLVHRCSTSYSEQYLDTFLGHSGPVYRVRCNPFKSEAFLTCSADWTMRLWTTKPMSGQPLDAPLLTFQSQDLSDAVNDVTWAPKNSTSFAAAMDDGRVELWDLSEKPLDPIVVHYPRASEPLRRRTVVRFSPSSPVLIAGDDQGSVDVMRMYNTNQQYYSETEQQDRLTTVMEKKR